MSITYMLIQKFGYMNGHWKAGRTTIFTHNYIYLLVILLEVTGIFKNFNNQWNWELLVVSHLTDSLIIFSNQSGR